MNRPLTLLLQDSENEGIPVGISRHQTFCSVDSYVHALLTCHNNRLTYQPNGVHGLTDAVLQMATLVLMRSIYLHFFDASLNNSPFVFSLTDLHPSNILVDEHSNVKWIIDLEWAASRPVEFCLPPEWLTSQAIDKIDNDAYDVVRKEFMQAFEEEERTMEMDMMATILGGRTMSSLMHDCWHRSTFWYIMALESPTGLFHLFDSIIEPLYFHSQEKDGKSLLFLSEFFHRRSAAFREGRISDKEDYLEKLKEEFGLSRNIDVSSRHEERLE